MPEAQEAYGERALLYHFHEQIKDSKKLEHEMWRFKNVKEKEPEYKRIHCFEWLREQISDWEAEQIRLAVRAGTVKGVTEGTDVPGGDGTGFGHIAAPAREGGRKTKSQKRQSAGDKAMHAAGLEAQAAAAQPGGRAPRPKAKAGAKGTDKAKVPAPHGVCFEYWDHGKCKTTDSGAACKWDHVRSNHPDAAGFIARAKAAARDKGQAAPANGTAQKPKSQIACKFFLLGTCTKGKTCDYSHSGGSAAPATDSTKEEKKKGQRARRATAYAAAATEEDGVAGACPVIMDDCNSDSS